MAALACAQRGAQEGATGGHQKSVSGIPSVLSPMADHILCYTHVTPLLLGMLLLYSNTLKFMLQFSGSYQALDLGLFGPWLLAFLVQWFSHNILVNTIFSGEVKQFADSAGPFGTKVLRNTGVSQASPGLSFSPFFTMTKFRTLKMASTMQSQTDLGFRCPFGTLSGVALTEQQADTAAGQYSFLHGDALFVIEPTDVDIPSTLHQEHSQSL